MKFRELGTIIVILAALIGFWAAHEASHVVSEKITGQPVTTIEGGK